MSELGQRVALDEVSQLHGGGSVEDEPRRAHFVVSCQENNRLHSDAPHRKPKQDHNTREHIIAAKTTISACDYCCRRTTFNQTTNPSVDSQEMMKSVKHMLKGPRIRWNQTNEMKRTRISTDGREQGLVGQGDVPLGRDESTMYTTNTCPPIIYGIHDVIYRLSWREGLGDRVRLQGGRGLGLSHIFYAVATICRWLPISRALAREGRF